MPLFLVDPTAFESLDAAPEPREIVAMHFLDAVRWSNDGSQEHGATLQIGDRGLVETMLVQNMERALARTAPPFRLRVAVIPVDGPHFWQLSLTTSWLLLVCCETPLNAGNGSRPWSGRCSDRYYRTAPRAADTSRPTTLRMEGNR